MKIIKYYIQKNANLLKIKGRRLQSIRLRLSPEGGDYNLSD